MRFISKIFHPNIYPDGRVCISILHAPGDDPLGYETSSERWSPVQSVEKVLLSVMSMLAEPNCESPANVDAAKMWRDAVSAAAMPCPYIPDVYMGKEYSYTNTTVHRWNTRD